MIARGSSGLEVRLAEGEVLRPDKVFYSAGRTGNTENLGLERVGVDLDPKGRIVVDETFRTSVAGIYAAGDVIGPPSLASVSMEQGRVAVCYAFGISFKDTVDPVAPLGVYSIPEVAMCGLTEDVALSRGLNVEVGRGWFESNSRAVIAGSTEGLVKLVFDRADRRLLGVHILCEGAGELVHLGQAVIQLGGQIDHFIPWARHPDNGIENLVFTDQRCNNDKRAFLASAEHVEGWAARFGDPSLIGQLTEIAEDRAWERHPDRTLSVARSIYLRLPDTARLWVAPRTFVPVDGLRLQLALATGL